MLLVGNDHLDHQAGARTGRGGGRWHCNGAPTVFFDVVIARVTASATVNNVTVMVVPPVVVAASLVVVASTIAVVAPTAVIDAFATALFVLPPQVQLYPRVSITQRQAP
jgi:hypothetical protein